MCFMSVYGCPSLGEETKKSFPERLDYALLMEINTMLTLNEG